MRRIGKNILLDMISLNFVRTCGLSFIFRKEARFITLNVILQKILIFESLIFELRDFLKSCQCLQVSPIKDEHILTQLSYRASKALNQLNHIWQKNENIQAGILLKQTHGKSV